MKKRFHRIIIEGIFLEELLHKLDVLVLYSLRGQNKDQLLEVNGRSFIILNLMFTFLPPKIVTKCLWYSVLTVYKSFYTPTNSSSSPSSYLGWSPHHHPPTAYWLVYSTPSVVVFVQLLSRVQLLCYPMDCSTSGFSVLHYLPQFAQTHVHWVSDAIQTFHPLSPLSPLALSLSQHQSLFKWVNSSH